MVKCVGRRNLAGVWMGGIVIAFGCADDTPLPGAPTPVSSPVAQGPMSPPDLLAVTATDRSLVGRTRDRSVDGTVGLKATPPMPVAPIDNVEVADAAPMLTVSNATGVNVVADFEHEFTLSKVTGGNEMEVERGAGTPAGPGTTSYRVQAALDLGASYTWRARPVLEGVYGPWSEDAGFRTVGVRLGVPQPLAPVDGATVGTRPLFRVENGTVEGDAGTVMIRIRVATDDAFMNVVASGETQARSRGETNVALGSALMLDTPYWWQARAVSTGPAGVFESSWSGAAGFRTTDVALGAPEPLDPIDGATTTTLRPLFQVRNGTVEGVAGTVNIQIQVATDSDFTDVVGQAETHARPRGDTNLQLADELMPVEEYFWRARARLQSDPDITSDWSTPGRFSTPDTSTEPTNAPGRGDCCPPPNRFDIVQAVLGRTGDLYRRDVQDFTQRVAECLAVTDGDWGRRRNDSGAIGKDTVAYRTSKGRGQGPFSIDIMLGATSGNPRPHWSIQRHDGVEGRVGGTWIEVDGSNCILGNVR